MSLLDDFARPCVLLEKAAHRMERADISPHGRMARSL